MKPGWPSDTRLKVVVHTHDGTHWFFYVAGVKLYSLFILLHPDIYECDAYENCKWAEDPSGQK